MKDWLQHAVDASDLCQSYVDIVSDKLYDLTDEQKEKVRTELATIKKETKMTFDEVCVKHHYRKLTESEDAQSRASHQHESMYPDERYALTLDIDKYGEWTHYDHRGDASRDGSGANNLDVYLTMFHKDDEK